MTSSNSVHATIARRNAEAVRCYALGDIDSLVSLFTEDAWQMPPNSPPLIGRQSIYAFWREAVQWGTWQFTLDTQDIAVSGSLAVERGKYVLQFTAGAGAPPGMTSFEDRGNYLAHWREDVDGEWRIAADAPVSELPTRAN